MRRIIKVHVSNVDGGKAQEVSSMMNAICQKWQDIDEVWCSWSREDTEDREELYIITDLRKKTMVTKASPLITVWGFTTLHPNAKDYMAEEIEKATGIPALIV